MAAESAPNTSVPVIKAPNGATPKPVEDVVNYSKRSISDDEFFSDIPPDELLDALNDDGEPEEKPKPRKPTRDREPPKPAKRKPEPEPEPEEEEDEEPLAAAADEEPEAEADPEPEADEEPETKAWSVPEGKGTKDAPLTLKDLPSDLLVEVSVNGEKVLIDLKEAAAGGMRRQAFDQQVSKIKQGMTDAHEIAEKAVSAQESMKRQLDQTRQGFEVFIRDPKRVLAALFENVPDKRRIVEALIDDHEDAYEELSFAYADMISRENGLAKDGYATARQRRAREREQRKYQRQQEELNRRERQIAEARQNWEREQAEKTKAAQESEKSTAAARAAFARLKPGLDAGLLALGLKDMTPELETELKVRLRVTTEMKKGAPLTPDDVKQALIRAGAVLGIKRGVTKPAPAGSSAPRRPAPAPTTQQNRQNGGNGGGKYDSMPSNQRVRDLEWYLNG